MCGFPCTSESALVKDLLFYAAYSHYELAALDTQSTTE
jgi:hypothetical protein